MSSDLPYKSDQILPSNSFSFTVPFTEQPTETPPIEMSKIDNLISVNVSSRTNSSASEDQDLITPIKSYGSTDVYIAKEASQDGECLIESSYFVDLEDLPQGRHLGLFSTIVLFISRIIGSGIWATPASVFAGTGGNPAIFFLLWLLSALMAFAGLYCYLELGSIIPRSGGTKVFLEYIYPKPKLLISVVYSIFALAFGVTLTNALVFAKYFLFVLGYDGDFIEKTRYANLVAIIFVLLTGLIHGVSVKHGVFVQNFLGFLKLFLVLIMAMTGIYVLVFPIKITGLENHFKLDSFFAFEDSTVVNFSSLTSAFLSSVFSFGGWSSVHTVASEIKDPVRTLRIAGPVSLFIAFVNYILINIAYLKVIPHEELMKASPLIGSQLFEKVLGYRLGRQFVTFSIALSAASNVFVVVYSLSRMNQEVFREGYLPYSSTLASNFKLTNTPLYAISLCCLYTIFYLVILPPNGNSFNYIVSLEGYPSQIFLLLTVIGIFIIRKRYPNEKAPIRSSLVGNAFIILISSCVIISPFLSGGVSESDPTYIKHMPPYYIGALIFLSIGVSFWAIKFKLLPYFGGYELKQEVEVHEDGLSVKRWVKA